MDIESFNFEQNYFDLFELPVSCEIDSTQLRAKFMELQRQYHPDGFAAASSAASRRAVQITAHINGAHQILSHPLQRAEYCLQLAGLSTDAETDAKMDNMFLMQQMELRESLEDVASAAEPYKALDSVRGEIDQLIEKTSVAASASIKTQDYDEARDLIRRWQFLEKLADEANTIEAQLDDA